MIYDAVVLGGGITGLSTAFYLKKGLESSASKISYAIFEASDCWGGKLSTKELRTEDGECFLIEEGPDSFMSQKHDILELVNELGLEGDIIDANKKNNHIWIYLRRQLIALPEGVIMMVPTKFLPFIKSPLISMLGKLRMALEPFLPANRDTADESLAQFVRRRMGSEVLEKIAEPLLGGIFSADPEKQSILASFPHFKEMENRYGSLIVGFLRARFKKPKERKSAISSLNTGMQKMCEVLSTSLKQNCFLNKEITQIDQIKEGRYYVRFSDGEEIVTKSLVLAMPACIAAKLIYSFAPEAALLLESIRYVSTGNVSLAYKDSDLPSMPKGFGVLVPKNEKRGINAISLSSQKFSGRAPVDYSLIRVSFGGSRNVEMMSLDDDSIVRRIRSDLADILGISSEPVLTHVKRWIKAMPQYDVGHQSRIEQIEESLPHGIFLAGSAYHGVSIPDCILQAKRTATSVLGMSNTEKIH